MIFKKISINLLTFVANNCILEVVSNQGGDILANKSRADYFRERRKTIGQFTVNISKEKIVLLDEILEHQGKTRTQWVSERIDEEISKFQKE